MNVFPVINVHSWNARKQERTQIINVGGKKRVKTGKGNE